MGGGVNDLLLALPSYASTHLPLHLSTSFLLDPLDWEAAEVRLGFSGVKLDAIEKGLNAARGIFGNIGQR
jgi:hypothetical protein